MLDRQFKVSVCVIAYNQENYIRQCLQSLVDQQTDFAFEVIVGDDCSTDNTRAIIEEFLERYPTMIRAIFQPVNTGGAKNFLEVHAAARGEYIAHMDGDDYALPTKLSVQVKYLDDHPDVNIVWHRMAYLYKDQPLRAPTLNPEGGALLFKKRDLLALGSVGHHSSKMYRAHLRAGYQMKIAHGYDFELDLLQVGRGTAVLLDSVLGVYRAGIGIASTPEKRSKILLGNVLLANFDKGPQYRGRISSMLLMLAILDLKASHGRSRRFARLYFENFVASSFFYFFYYLPLRITLRYWHR